MSNWLSSSLFYGAAISILAYEAGLLIRRRFKLAILNPLLLAVIIVMGVNAVLKIDYEAYNGGAQYLSYLLTPTTVCLAVPMYEQLTLLKDNWKA
ncbi:MAG: LrgB family protein, partial [Clostridia bacterium]|nr:LrgB family protein [Clostridia bacterium]